MLGGSSAFPSPHGETPGIHNFHDWAVLDSSMAIFDACTSFVDVRIFDRDEKSRLDRGQTVKARLILVLRERSTTCLVSQKSCLEAVLLNE